MVVFWGERNVRYRVGTSDDQELLPKKASNSDEAVKVPELYTEETVEERNDDT